MAKKLSPGTSALGVKLLVKCSATDDLPAPGGPVITISSPTATQSMNTIYAARVLRCRRHWLRTRLVASGVAAQSANAHCPMSR